MRFQPALAANAQTAMHCDGGCLGNHAHVRSTGALWSAQQTSSVMSLMFANNAKGKSKVIA
jgi:hypothetical protein